MIMNFPIISLSVLTFFGVNFVHLEANTRIKSKYGKFIGNFTRYSHEIKGSLYAVDENVLFIKSFWFDGTGPGAYFWAGNTTIPSPNGFIIPHPETNYVSKLKAYRNQDVILRLPFGKRISDIRWLSVWCTRFTVNFGVVYIPPDLKVPKARILPELKRLSHGLRSGNITILDAKTFYIPNLHYDGEDSDTYFLVGSGDEPHEKGFKVPNEMGALDALRSYMGEDIEIQLPQPLTVYAIDWLSVYCIRNKQDFGHVFIPKDLDVPPALGQTRITTTTSTTTQPFILTSVDNCRELLNGRLQVQWEIVGDNVKIQLNAQMREDQCVAFGISDMKGNSSPLDGDLVIVSYDPEEHKVHAENFYMGQKVQCDGNSGICPEEMLGTNNDIIVLHGDRINDLTTITYMKPLKTMSALKSIISTVFAAFGQLNNTKQADVQSLDVNNMEFTSLNFSSTDDSHCSVRSTQHETIYPIQGWPSIQLQNVFKFVVRIGPSGGAKGYSYITGESSWGIAFYINDYLIPELIVRRGETYVFEVESGNNPSNPAKYHPLYITDSKQGGYGQSYNMGPNFEKFYAGVKFDPNGYPYPTAAGHYCEWVPKTVDRANKMDSFRDYFKTLKLQCDPGNYAYLNWTVPLDAPNTLYYQCYNHLNLGWKIHVLNQGSTGFQTEANLFLLLIVGSLTLKAWLKDFEIIRNLKVTSQNIFGSELTPEMGNYLSGIAPTQIYPIEHYLTDYKDLQFNGNLGSTRFMKVARVQTQEGLAVVKVFAIHDPSLPLTVYKERLDNIRLVLRESFNCLPFRRIELSEKCGLLVREYMKHSLYDRISTRPFLTNIEKTWITFQILYALNQCHRLNICHGDLKLENIMLTSWNWVVLTDFASFKPTYLPEDNPADYSYFFDTSRRDICCIAPERFVKSGQQTETSNTSSSLSGSGSTSMFNELSNIGNLTPAMDVFSAGCVLVELWNDGKSPFDLSQLLSYRTGEYNPDLVLNEIENVAVRLLIGNMIEKDPLLRKSVDFYLDQERNQLFPEYFYSFLQLFSTIQILPSDERISRLHKDIGHIIKILKDDTNDYHDGLLLIITLITSCIRGLHHSTSKINALDALVLVSECTNNEIILDHIVPYVIYLMRDSVPKVRSFAIITLTKCLNYVKAVPLTDTNIFPDYIIPELQYLINDRSVLVRRTFAAHIGSLAEISMRFLKSNRKTDSAAIVIKEYEMETQNLQKLFEQLIIQLLIDQQSIVKRTLIAKSIQKLCSFLQKQKINDTILSHMITFLNDKDDPELRGCFFQYIVQVACFVGKYCCLILSPLLQQGLSDNSEFVVVKCLQSMTQMAKYNLLSQPILIELLKECMPFLIHPNLWIQHNVAIFVAESAKYLSDLELICKILPMIQPLLQYDMIQINETDLLLDSILKCIPREVYDDILKCSDFENVLNALSKPKHDDKPVSENIKKIMLRLVSVGMTEEVGKKVLFLRNHLSKIRQLKWKPSSKDSGYNSLYIPSSMHSNSMTMTCRKSDGSNKRPMRSSLSNTENQEWQKMFGSVAADREHESTESEVDGQNLTVPSTSNRTYASDTVSSNSMQERSYIQYEVADCRSKLRKMLEHQQDLYKDTLNYEDLYAQEDVLVTSPLANGQPRGVMVNQLQEHTKAINSLVTVTNTSLFASCSNDGRVLLWDVSKMSGFSMENRSKQTFSLKEPLPFTNLCSNNTGSHLATGVKDGRLFILRVTNDSSKMYVEHKRQLNVEDDGFVVDCQFLESISADLLLYGTLYGTVYGWDTRSPDVAFRFQNSLKSGIITSICQGVYRSWLTIGTTSGMHITWDLRFQLPIATINHPNAARVHKLIRHPVKHSYLISSVQGNNETSIWNLETGFRHTVLWASKAPSLSHTNVSDHSICAMYAGKNETDTFVLTAGTDQRIRYWNLTKPESSHLVVPSANEKCPLNTKAVYNLRIIDGTNVIRENFDSDSATNSPNEGSSSASSPTIGDSPKGRFDPVLPGHTDWITSLIVCKSMKNNYMITGDKSGVIKVWR